MKATTIKLNISGREYPVNVTPETEAAMVKAAALINDQIKSYSSSYAISDPRDLLAMCALQLAFQNLEKENIEHATLEKIKSKVQAIESALEISK